MIRIGNSISIMETMRLCGGGFIPVRGRGGVVWRGGKDEEASGE